MDHIDNLEHLTGHGAGSDYGLQHHYDGTPPDMQRGTLDKDGNYIGSPVRPRDLNYYEEQPSTTLDQSDRALTVREQRPTGMLTQQTAVTAVPVTVAYARRERTAAVILNTDAANTVYVGGTANTATPLIGFPIPPGSSITISNTGDVWASTLATAVVAVLDEYLGKTGL